MKLRILLAGKSGQVGAELAAILPRLGEVAAFDHYALDLSKPDHIRRAVRDVRPSIIVNAAAYTLVDQAETEEKRAHIINVDAPALMAEEAIRAVGLPHLIFRTAWVYGKRGRNFLLTILRLATESEELKVVRDQFGAPTWSHEIAKGTGRVLLQISQEGTEAISKFGGVYHMTAAGKTSWFEFAKAILEEAARMPRGIPWFETATKGQPLVTRRVNSITTEEYPAPARRPAYSLLSNSRLKQDFGLELPAWSLQLRAVFAEGRTNS